MDISENWLLLRLYPHRQYKGDKRRYKRHVADYSYRSGDCRASLSESCQRSRHLLPACSSVRGGLAVEGTAPSRVHITTWLSVVRADFVGKWALIHFLAGIVWPSQHLQNTTRRSPARQCSSSWPTWFKKYRTS